MGRVAIAAALAGSLFGEWACPLRAQEGERPNLAPIALGAPAQTVVAEQVRRALQETTEIDFDRVPLADALAQLAERHRIHFDVDQPALADAQIAADAPVTLRATGIMLDSALRLLLDPIGLTCLVRNSEVFVTTQDRAAATLSIKVYPIADLAIARQGDPPGERLNYADVTEGTRDMLMLQFEQHGGERFAISSLAEARALVALETDEGHQQTAALLASLRQARDAQQSKQPSFDPILVIPAPQRAARERINRALAEKVTFAFDEQPLSGVAAQLADRFNIHIWLDPQGLEESGISPTTPISALLSGLTLDGALRQMLGPKQLAHMARDESLLITSSKQASGITELYVYPVADLIETVGPLAIPQYNDVIILITLIVEPTTWMEGTGPDQRVVAIRCAQSLVVWQAASAHQEIAALLGALRQARDEQLREKPNRRPIEALPPVEIEARAKIHRALDQPADFDFRERPLTEVVDALKKRYQIEIQIDRAALEDADVDPNLPVTRVSKGTSLRSALQSTLAEVDLEYVIRDEMLVITAKEAVNYQMVLTKVYPVGDLVFRGPAGGKLANFRALIEAVESTGGPNGWAETGGMGQVVGFRPSLSLVISQTDAVHDEIEKLLTEMRRDRGGRETGSNGAK